MSTFCSINSRRSACAAQSPDALVLHPGPMIRGLEIDPAVADGPQSCVLEQVTNGLAVRMALLFLMIGGAAERSPEKDSLMLLIKNGRVIDPASGTDARMRRPARRRSHRASRRRAAQAHRSAVARRGNPRCHGI
jgi:hypothetical protein